MNTFGQHLMVEYRGCDTAILNDIDRIETAMRHAARAANTTVVAATFHRFSPQGVSGVVVVEESHLSIHTWPECGYAAVDFYTCGDGVPEQAHEVLRAALGADEVEVMSVRRGLEAGSSMRLESHYRETGNAGHRRSRGEREREHGRRPPRARADWERVPLQEP